MDWEDLKGSKVEITQIENRPPESILNFGFLHVSSSP